MLAIEGMATETTNPCPAQIDSPGVDIRLVHDKGIVVVDESDIDLSLRRWYDSAGYASTYAGKVMGKTVLVRMHRLIMARILGRELRHGEMVDHIDGNSRNNRRSNLRLCNHAQNGWNSSSRRGTSTFKGILWNPKNSRWIARIRDGKKANHIGTFDTEEEAARAYDAAARLLHGEFANTNFPT